VTKNFGEKRPTGAIFLDVAKAFDTVWDDGLFFKLTALNFPSYLVEIISSYLHNRTVEAAFLTATSTRRFMCVGVAQGELVSPVLFRLYVNDMPVPSRHVESELLIRCLETYLSDLDRWLREWRIAINV
jgi:hypothetical protein